MRKPLEILAPVGAEDMLTAALRCRADAVYFGIGSLNARRAADAPENEDLKNWVDQCHIHGVKAYGAMNTIAFDNEFENIEKSIQQAAKSGVDGMIVADLGVVAYWKKLCPEMPLHASTQMSVNSVNGAKELLNLGFSRVVLGRELTFEEIHEIIKEVPIETELFVHGAHCFAISGQCTMSSFIGSRSGNRGMCAQPCRLPFYNEKENGSALSLKDLSLVEYIPALQEIGVSSVKIEGRMKRPEYVAAAVTACVSGRDEKESFSEDLDRLKKVFSRSGFTDGYYKNQMDGEMFGTRQKSDVVAAESVFSPLRQLYHKEQPTIPIELHFTMEKGKEMSLSIEDSIGHKVKVTGDIPLENENAVSMDISRVEKSLSKFGNTPYFIKENGLHLSLQNGVSAPVSALNAMRREGTEKLNQARSSGYEKKVFPFQFEFVNAQKIDPPKIYVRFTERSEITSEILEQADQIILPALRVLKMEEIAATFKEKIFIEPPRASFGKEKKITEALAKCKEKGYKGLSITNLGDIQWAEQFDFIPFASFSMNLLNSAAIDYVKQLGVREVELSLEMDFLHAAKLQPTIATGLVAYGNIPVMISRQCPGKAESGCRNCTGEREMKDRIGNTFYFGCNSLKTATEIYNPYPIWLADQKEKLAMFSFLSLYFTEEPPTEMSEIIKAYRQGLSYKPEKITRGLTARPLL